MSGWADGCREEGVGRTLTSSAASRSRPGQGPFISHGLRRNRATLTAALLILMPFHARVARRRPRPTSPTPSTLIFATLYSYSDSTTI